MKAIIACGGRNWQGFSSVLVELLQEHKVSMLIHGAARGADHAWASAASFLGIASFPFRADWDSHGKAAGPIRNSEMLRELLRLPPLGVITEVWALPGGTGTADMLRRAREAGVITREFKV